MDAAFTSIAFAEPERAETNLTLLERRLPATLWATLPTLLAQVADPDEALNYLERYLREAPARVLNHLSKHPAALHYLLVLFSYSRFLSETLVQQPELITWLHRPRGASSSAETRLERLKSTDDLHEEFARFQATSFEQTPAVVLARFKRREYLRITLRDVLGLATLGETTLELSQLADVLLERAQRISEQKLCNAYGNPQFADSAGRVHAARITILALGKLGGRELNYNSDIDLIFLYDHDGETSGGSQGTISNAEFFVRLAQAVLKIITEPTAEGAVFRVDLRLRPEGSEGSVALSYPAALAYYRERAREWELQMLIKARPSAGDADLGRKFSRQVQPLIYREKFNLGAVEAVLNARQEISRELRRRPGAKAERGVEWNVKLSPGGIRDIEFLTQCLQRLYGGAEPWLASAAAGSTLVALQRLHDKGHLTGRDFFRLGTAYQFLRRVEHRLQLRDGLQVHTLPGGAEALERLARRASVEPAGGRSAGEQLLQRTAQHFAEVREIYDRILFPKLQREGDQPAEGTEVAEADPAAGPLLRRLRAEYPGVAHALDATAWAKNAYARRGLQQFLSSALLDPALMAQLAEHPAWVASAGELCARSDLAAEMLARHPEEIRLVGDPVAAGGDGASALARPGDGMAALRIAHRRGVLAAAVRALRGQAQPFDTFAVLTRLADTALGGALELAAHEVLGNGELDSAPFAAIALGRLGTAEMDIGSDADLVFVADERATGEERDQLRRLAERFVQVVSSHTREGLLFPVDTRLRPRGTEGEIVQSLGYWREYFRQEAAGWEAATFLKARPIAGNRDLAARAIAEVNRILAERFGAGSGNGDGRRELSRQLAHTRGLLEKERAQPSVKGGFKTEPGGYYDIEYILAFLFLTGGAGSAALEPHGHILRQIAQLESASRLDPSPAQALRSAALLYRSVDHAVRLVAGHPASRVPESPLAERVAVLLKQWQIPQADSLFAAVEEARSQVRALYDQVISGVATHP